MFLLIATRNTVPAARSMTGVAVTPISGDTWPQLRSSLAVSPVPSSDTCHRMTPLSASKAYTLSFSVATSSTLCEAPLMV